MVVRLVAKNYFVGYLTHKKPEFIPKEKWWIGRKVDFAKMFSLHGEGQLHTGLTHLLCANVIFYFNVVPFIVSNNSHICALFAAPPVM